MKKYKSFKKCLKPWKIFKKKKCLKNNFENY